MKVHVFVTFAVCLFQVHHAFDVANHKYSDDAELRADLEKLPGIDEQTVQSVIALVHKYENNTVALMDLAFQGDTCVKNQIDSNRIFTAAKPPRDNEDSEEDLVLFADLQLQVVENEFSKILTPEKVQNAMKLLRSLQESGLDEHMRMVWVNMLVYAEKAVAYGCPTEATENPVKQ